MKSLAIARIFALTVFKVCVCVFFFSVHNFPTGQLACARIACGAFGTVHGLPGLCDRPQPMGDLNLNEDRRPTVHTYVHTHSRETDRTANGARQIQRPPRVAPLWTRVSEQLRYGSRRPNEFVVSRTVFPPLSAARPLSPALARARSLSHARCALSPAVQLSNREDSARSENDTNGVCDDCAHVRAAAAKQQPPALPPSVVGSDTAASQQQIAHTHERVRHKTHRVPSMYFVSKQLQSTIPPPIDANNLLLSKFSV